MTATITIAIPTFERIEYLDEAINSVLQQTIAADEVIVIDNGSSHSRIKNLVATYKGVKYYRHQNNIGMFSNWNSCASLSTKEYFMILGDDDLLDKNFIKKIKQHLDINNPDLIFTDYQPFSANDSNSLWKAPVFFGDLNGDDIRSLSVKHGLFFPVVSCVIRRDKFTPFYSAVHGSNDWLWSISLPSDFKVHGIPDTLVKYRKHGEGDSETGLWRNIFTHMCIYWKLHQSLHEKSTTLSLISGFRASKCAALLKNSGKLHALKDSFYSTENKYKLLSIDFEKSLFSSLIVPVLIGGLKIRNYIRELK